MKDLLRKGFSIITIFVYMFVMLFQTIPFQSSFLNEVSAEDALNKDNLVLVLVDSDIYGSIKNDISWYANTYIQNVEKNTKAIVFPINTKLVKSYNIQEIIKNLYLNGEKTKTSFLKTVVLIGNVPLPVVKKGNFIYKSIYPYVDIIKPTFVYDGKTNYFKFSGKASNVELSHGIIKFDSIDKYHKYFQKLKKYYQNPTAFVDKKFYYDNFVSQEKSFSKDVLKYYLNKIIFAENILTKKINPLLLKYFNKQYNDGLSSTLGNMDKNANFDANSFKGGEGKLAEKLGFDSKSLSSYTSINNKYKKSISDFNKKISGFKDQLKSNNFNSIPTLKLESSLKSFFKNFNQLFGNTYGANITKNLDATARYNWDNTISSLNLIDIKDNLSLTYINTINKVLEKEIDKKIDSEQYFMYYPLMTSYIDGDNWNYSSGINVYGYCNKKKYENFYFGKNAININSLADLHIYRGTFGNFTGINLLKNILSRGKKSSVSIMNNFFDRQTLSNRGYNVMLAQKDANNYKNNCSKLNGACTNLGKNSNSESIQNWSKRIYGGYSPLNIDTNSMKEDPSNMKLNYFNYKQAWHPSDSPNKNGILFDLGGTKKVKNKQSTGYTDTINALKHYSSVWKTEYYNKNILGGHGNYNCIKKYTDGYNRTSGNYYGYLKDFGNICKEVECSTTSLGGIINTTKKTCSVNQVGNTMTVVSYNGTNGINNGCYFSKDKTFKYKFIDTRIKHISPTQKEFSGFNIATKARPIDSKNYISFIGVGGNTVKLDYPDLFNVYVYKDDGKGNYILKTPEEIAQTINFYLKSIVIKYNDKLKNELDKKNTYYNKYKNARDKITDSKYKPHSYNLLPENFLIDKLGKKQIAIIAEQLYYLNIGWKVKPSFSTLSGELNYLYNSFDIGKKIGYVTKNYIDTESKNNINNVDISNLTGTLPFKPNNGYEAGLIISKNEDGNIGKKSLGSQNNINNLLNTYNPGLDIPLNPDQNSKNECGRPVGQAVIIFQWPSAVMCWLKETLKKPFKIGSTSECVVGDTVDDIKNKLGGNGSLMGSTFGEDDGSRYKNESLEKYNEWKKWKYYVDSNISIKTNNQSYFYDSLSGNLQITNYDTDNKIKDISVLSPSLTGNCLYFNDGNNYVNSCEGFTLPDNKWKIPFYFFNSKTGEGKYYSYKAGTKYLNLKICNYDNICYIKKITFDKQSGKLQYVKITPFSNTMVYGGEDPFVIEGYDALPEQGRFQNKITYTPYNYKLFLDPSIGVIKSSLETKGKSSIDYNFPSSESLLVVKSNTEKISGLSKFNIDLKLSPEWQEVYKNDKTIIKEVKKSINIIKKEKLLDSEVKFSSNNYQLPEDSSNLLLKVAGGLYTYDKSKLLKIHINPIVADRTLKTPLTVNSTKQFIVGKFIKTEKKLGTKTYKYEKFVKQNKFLITKNGGIDVYLLPTYITGKYKINVSVPGISPYIKNGEIKSFPTEGIVIKLDKKVAEPNEVINGTIYKVDKFGNYGTDLAGLNLTSSDGIIVIRNGNKIKVKGTKSGFIKAELDGKQTSVYVVINKTFLPIDKKISVMYLTLFGYDWGKYASKIMSNSSKNLAITTLDNDPKSLHSYDYILGENLKIDSKYSTKLKLDGDKLIFDVGNFDITYPENIFSSIKKVDSVNQIISNGIYYVPEKKDDIIKLNILSDGQIYINSSSVINFNKLTQDSNISIYYNVDLSDKNGLSIYDIIDKDKKIGELVFKGKYLNLSKLKVSKPYFTKQIYAEGTTNGVKGLGISISDDSYSGISKNTDINIIDDKGLGFRSNFKNITNFAGGNDVGQATKGFENEFMINYGDPFVKRISKEKTIAENNHGSNIHISKTYGYKIYTDIAGGIKKVIPLDFNNDGLKDLLIIYKDGKVRLLKNYKGSNNFENLGNLVIIGKGIKDAFAGDVNGDSYEDLFVTFNDGSIRVYKNNHGEFDVNGHLVCLDLPKSDGMHLYYDQIFFRDMNNDGKTDIVVNDKASNVKVYFGGTYLSTNLYKCDKNYKSRLKSKLVKSYSYKVDVNKQFADDGYIYWEGMVKNTGLVKKDTFIKAFKNKDFSNIPLKSNITPSNYLKSVSQKGKDKFAYQSIPKNLAPSYVDLGNKDSIDFKKITYLSGEDSVEIYKTMEDLDGGSLLPGDKVKITLHVNNKTNKRITYLEALKGPFSVISKDNKPILELNGISSGNISYPLRYPTFLFKVDNVSISFTISYLAYFQGSSSVKIKVGDWDKNKYGDIKIFLKNGCIKGYDYFQGQSGNPMIFTYSYVDLASKLKDKLNNSENTKSTNDMISNIKDKLNNLKNNPGNSTGLENILNSVGINSLDNVYGTKDGKLDSLLNGGDLNLEANIGPDLGAIKARVGKVLQGLCKGFSFGKSSCGGPSVPCNFAFLAPGTINACGCPLGTDPGTPIFWFPGALGIPTPGGCAGPFPVPYMGTTSGPPLPGAMPTGCWPVGLVSQIRIYLAPTLTSSLGVAVCFGPYKVGMHAPPAPIGGIAGNCIVAAVGLKNKCSGGGHGNGNSSADDQLDPWMDDLDNGICAKLPVTTGIYPTNSFSINGGGSFINSDINPASGLGQGGGMNGLINFSANATKINSPQDAGALMKGGVPFTLHVQTGTFGGLIKCIIKKWMNRQIEFFIAQLTHMTLYVVYPSFDGMLDGFKLNNLFNWNRFKTLLARSSGNSFSDLGKNYGGFGQSSDLSKKLGYDGLSTIFPSKSAIKNINRGISSPFKAVQAYFEYVPLINISLKTVVIKVPWIGKDEIDRQISYINNWLNRNKKAINWWENIGKNILGDCNGDKECEQTFASMLKVKKFINSVQKNIEILNQYKNFPLKLYKYLHLIDFYLSQVACIINKYFDMIFGWFTRQSLIFEKWVDAIITLINIIKTWQLIIDFSLNWKTTCGKCRQDTGDLYDCVLSLLCIDLPILPIPPFKIPDIYLDFSHFNLGIDIVLPKIKIAPVPIGLFTLPNLPYGFAIEVPTLPLLPAPPELPELPSLPPMPTIELPNLPPAPKIPKLPGAIKAVLNALKVIGYFRCIIKNGIGLVAEWNVKSRIEQLTARTNRIFPFDFLNIEFPVLPFKGFDIRVDTYVNFKMDLSQVYDFVKGIAKSINKKTNGVIGGMLEFNAKTNNSTSSFQDGVNNTYDKGAFISPHKKTKKVAYTIIPGYGKNIEYVEPKVDKLILYNELSYLISQKGASYLLSLPDSIFTEAENIRNNLIKPINVKPNKKGVNNIKNKVNDIIDKQRSRLDEIKNIIKKMEKGQKVDTSNKDIFYKEKTNNLVSDIKDKDEKITLGTSLFTISDFAYSLIHNSKNPNLIYLNGYKKVLTKLDKKLEKYKVGKPKKAYQYETLQNKVENSLNVINNTLGDNLSYAGGTAPVSTPSFPLVSDPTQNIKGLYIKGDDNIYYNMLKDKEKAQKIRNKKTYVLSDMNNDGEKDMIWYDDYNVYIKYSSDDPKDKGVVISTSYVYPNIVNNFNDIVDDRGYVKIGDSKFKILDKKLPVNTLKLNGQTYNDITLKWDKPKYNYVNSYTILYSSRVDILNDIEKGHAYNPRFRYFNRDYKTYAVVLYDKKLGNVNEFKASKIVVNGHKFVQAVYIPVDLSDNMSMVLDKSKLFFNDKWKYFRVYNSSLNLEMNKLDILSSYSNQEVGSEQIINDDTSPFVITTLERVHGNELNHIVGTGTKLKGYINTSYKLKGVWSDNLGLDKKYITDDKYNILSTGDSIDIEENQPVKKIYHFIGVDLNGNHADIRVTVNIKVPKIDITKINTEVGIVDSKVQADMDKTAVKFLVKYGNITKILDNIKGINIFTGGVGKTNFTGSIFDMDKKLILYGEDGKTEIGDVNLEDGKITLIGDIYTIIGEIKNNSIIYNVYKINQIDDGKVDYKSLFKIHLPVKELVKTPEIYNADKYSIETINNKNMGNFDGGYCLKDNIQNMCAVYVSTKGVIYVDNNYKDSFRVGYKFKDGNITSTFYDLTIPDRNLMTNDKRLFSITYKVDKMY